jgi:hypothetical protein
MPWVGGAANHAHGVARTDGPPKFTDLLTKIPRLTLLTDKNPGKTGT